MRRISRFLLLMASAGIAAIAPAQTDEARLKAEFLIRFAAYTSWPARSFASDTSPIFIGVWKDSAFARTVADVRGNRTAGSRPIQVRTLSSYNDASEVHILFVPASHADDLPRLMTEVKRAPVLTVSEVAGFCARGGMMNFYKQGSYLRFEANPDAARAAGVQISSQLLKLAKIVGGNE
jgi:hypothetical protein